MEVLVEKQEQTAQQHNTQHPLPVFDICIVGAGVAGAAMAAYLGKAGKRVVIIEKDYSEQDRIVGELLQPGGVEKIKELGLADCLENIDAAPVHGYAIYKNGQEIQIAYPEGFTGRGFRNGKFVQNLRHKLEIYPNITRIEGQVTELKKDRNGKITGVVFTDKKTDTTQEIQAELSIVCDGFFSVFRKELSQNQAKISGFFLGIVLQHVELPKPGHGHVFLTESSPFLAYPVTSSSIRMLIDFPGTMPPKKTPDLKKELKVKILPFLPQSMHASFLAAVEEGDFKVMPNHYMPAKPQLNNGAVLLGDALTMRHPLTGGGMTAVYTDVLALGKLILEGNPTNDVIQAYYASKRRDNSTINILADALYRVFRSKGLADACFAYLAQGGKYAKEPVSILSGVSRDKNLLIRHFFAVAVFGAKSIMRSGGSLTQAYRMVHDAFQIVYPLLMNEKPRRSEKIIMNMGRLIFPIK